MVNRPILNSEFRILNCALALLLLSASSAAAQGTGRGFLFRAPNGSVSLRTGYDRATAGSDLFTFVTDQLTVNPNDFNAVAFAFDVDYRLTPRVDAVFGVGSSRTKTRSEFRNWVDNKRQPIEQSTEFQRVPITAAVKAYLRPPGQSIGHFAWVPARFAPYVGAGGGAMWYRFQQQGDFIAFDTLKVFTDTFDSNGWTPTVHALGGVEISLASRLAIATEARYEWAKARLGRDFSGFDRIDLSGISFTSGVIIRY
jgi:hypothetical protein